MWRQARDIIKAALRDFARSYKALVVTSLIYRLIAFALLAPATALFLRWLLSRTGSKVVADADIAQFFLNTPAGLLALVLGGALLGTITALELTCLMTIGMAAARGGEILPRTALAYGAKKAQAVLRLVGHMVLRLVLGLIPFLLILGGSYFALLRRYDINYYLTEKPPSLWMAAAAAGIVLIALAALLVRTAARWSLALPLLLYEGVHPARALGASAKRAKGRRPMIVIVLLFWAVLAQVLGFLATWLVKPLGRTLAPLAKNSLPLLLFILTVLVVVWFVLTLGGSVFQTSFGSLALGRIYLTAGPGKEPQVPTLTPEEARRGLLYRLTPKALGGIAAAGVLIAIGAALLVFTITRTQREVAVIAHRGGPVEAPENTIAAFRQAIENGADYVEFDVQESLDGEVVVTHDTDLMKLGGSSNKIWESTAAELRAVDIGSRIDPKYANERVPTLAEALAACKGGARVAIELKSYGHNQMLEEKVAALVEAAGMEKECFIMSLDAVMVDKMKRLRPDWRVGLLVAKALGDAAALKGDFLAVEMHMASVGFVRRAHRAGREVYAWTVNDPVLMLRMMAHGVDGLITDRPAMGRRVVDRREQLSDAQRLLVAILIRLGTRIEGVAAEINP